MKEIRSRRPIVAVELALLLLLAAQAYLRVPIGVALGVAFPR